MKQAKEQAVLGIVFDAIKGIKVNGVDRIAICEAVGLSEQIKQQNRLVNQRAEMLTGTFALWGYKTCVLKGQGVAQLYSEALLRQSGDIDIWVDGTSDEIISELRNNTVNIRNIDYVHSGCAFFDDVEVEVHFRPSWLYNPFTNRRLQKFFEENVKEQFENVDAKVDFAYPTIQFNLVYSLSHINRHVFSEGIGLRQLVDYYYILKHSVKEERDYLKEPNMCVCTPGYYARAITEMNERVKPKLHVIFSDDIQWCKENIEELVGNREVVFVDWNKGEQSFRDIQLMTLCKHNIIANSSFSWWGAWLNQNEGKVVVAPEKFTNGNPVNDPICEDWVKVKS